MSGHKVTEYKHYIGDVDLEYGGVFFDIREAKYGYVDFLEVIDLDSAAGVDDTVLVERGTVGIDDEGINNYALRCCGVGRDEIEEGDQGIVLAWVNHCCGATVDRDPRCRLVIWRPFDPDGDERPDLESWGGEIVELDPEVDLVEYLEEEGYLSEFE